ncbi:hypothetical protein J4448_04165 [Candidatus Woesearchaeota archaeon]|nr:hypothetical protein [Candidatus Woesearchaeota archaeon]
MLKSIIVFPAAINSLASDFHTGGLFGSDFSGFSFSSCFDSFSGFSLGSCVSFIVMAVVSVVVVLSFVSFVVAFSSKTANPVIVGLFSENIRTICNTIIKIK